MFAIYPLPQQERDGLLLLGIHSLTSRDGYHIIDVLNRTTTTQVIDRTGNTLKNRTYGDGIAEALYKFISDVSHLKIRENKRWRGQRWHYPELSSPTEGTRAASACSSPSIFNAGSSSLANFVASITLSTTSCVALPLVEKLNMATRGSVKPATLLAVCAVQTAI